MIETSSPTAGPASTSLFHVSPKALRLIFVDAAKPRGGAVTRQKGARRAALALSL
jgi:hypothetical protein